MSCQRGDKTLWIVESGPFTLPLCSPSLDKILAAMTIAAERNNKERFASIVEGLENHEAQQLQVWNHNIQLLYYFLNFNITTIKKKHIWPNKSHFHSQI